MQQQKQQQQRAVEVAVMHEHEHVDEHVEEAEVEVFVVRWTPSWMLLRQWDGRSGNWAAKNGGSDVVGASGMARVEPRVTLCFVNGNDCMSDGVEGRHWMMQQQ